MTDRFEDNTQMITEIVWNFKLLEFEDYIYIYIYLLYVYLHIVDLISQ
jgi:hypothetical protein